MKGKAEYEETGNEKWIFQTIKLKHRKTINAKNGELDNMNAQQTFQNPLGLKVNLEKSKLERMF